jgi:UDP-N-acetylmuramate--alanine ligase
MAIGASRSAGDYRADLVIRISFDIRSSAFLSQHRMDWSLPHRVHLVGIAGAGMRALADVLRQRGWDVTGSDASTDGHAAERVGGDRELLVYSSAVPCDNVELQQAVRRGIAVLSYFETVGRLTQGMQTVAIAGTHGKSTTTAMLAAILEHAGRRPTVFCGATPLGRRSGGRAGQGNLALVEACEYRANFLELRPTIAAVLGIEPDHFDCFAAVDELHAAFAQFVQRLPADGLLVVSASCPAARRIAAQAPCRVQTIGVGGDWSMRDVASDAGFYRFTVCHEERAVARVTLNVPGWHNAENALIAAALASHLEAPSEALVDGLAAFAGLERRFQRLGERQGVAFVDDYAHHPTEVVACLRAVREVYPGRRVVCVFQPHQGLRLSRLLDEFARSLQNADLVAVTEVFRAREGPPAEGEATAEDLAARLSHEVLDGDRTLAAAACRVGRLLTAGDVLVTLGAGDIRRLTQMLLKERTNDEFSRRI